MAIVKIVQGDLNIAEMLPEYVLVTSPDKIQFTVRPHDGKMTPKVIDALYINDTEFIRWAIENTCYPLVILFADGKLPFKKFTFDTENKVEVIKGIIKEKANIFSLCSEVTHGTDRGKVYQMLKKNSSGHYFIYCSLVSNIQRLGTHNRGVLEFIDQNAFLKNTDRFCELLAFSFKPVAERFRPEWKYPKKEKED